MTIKPIRITTHARFGMSRRGIRLSDVVAVIRHEPRPGLILDYDKAGRLLAVECSSVRHRVAAFVPEKRGTKTIRDACRRVPEGGRLRHVADALGFDPLGLSQRDSGS